MASPNTRPHVVVLAPPIIGHLRPVCAFAPKLAALKAVDVTLLLPNAPNTFALGRAEAARGLAAEGPSLQGTLRVVAFGAPHAINVERLVHAEKDAFAPVWAALAAAQPIPCAVTGALHPPLAPPAVAVVSSMQFALFDVIRAGADAPPIYAFQSSAGAGVAHHLLPPAFGGGADDLAAPFNAAEQAHGRRYGVSGKIVKTPGLPDVYDWELHPADTSVTGMVPGVFPYIANLNMQALTRADGIISATTPAFDGADTLASIIAWAAAAGRPFFSVGPLRPFEPGTTRYAREALDAEVASVPGGVGAQVMAFLDEVLERRGKESVVYVGLGSMFWPFTNPDHMWALIDTLDERGIPFILSHPSPFAKVPERLQVRFGLASNGNGLLVPFAPQQAVLAHPAIAWFVTHGGMGGTMDAITQGVPMIAWPFTGDQPSNVARLVHTADAAFELIEARTGPWATKPLLASGKTPTGTVEAFKQEVERVLEEAFGVVGERKRRNARRMREELGGAWREGGPARRDLDAFAERHGL